MGSEELENQITAFIDQHLDLLGFEPKDMNFSGLSMGTFWRPLLWGSLFSSCDLGRKTHCQPGEMSLPT